MMTYRGQPDERKEKPLAQSIEAAARLAFSRHVRIYDERDQIIVHDESDRLRVVYMCIRASEQSNTATFVQFRLDNACKEMSITSLQMSGELQRHGLGHELVNGVEATATAIGVSSVAVKPLPIAVRFWEASGYTPDDDDPQVFRKELNCDSKTIEC